MVAWHHPRRIVSETARRVQRIRPPFTPVQPPGHRQAIDERASDE
jgi:hypothetical protein